MKLLKILATCSVLDWTNAAFSERTHLPGTTGSDHMPPTLSLTSTLQPVNTTHIDVSITNTYPQQISILSWNNHLQTNQNSAHGSFRLTHRSSNGTIQRLGRGPTMGHYRFAKAVPSHFSNITARGTYTDTFDLTRLFNVPAADVYSVNMEFTSPAILVANDTNLNNFLPTASSTMSDDRAINLSSVRITSDTVSMYLRASLPSQQIHKRTGNLARACSSQLQAYAAVAKARGNARSLAKFSEERILPPLGIAAHGVSY